MNYDAFLNKWNGKQVTAYGGECVALVAQYLVENGKPIAYANAKDWWGHPAISGSYDFITNNPNDYNQVPNRGDVVVWNGGLAGSGGYGHIAIFDRVSAPGQFVSFDQNWGGRQAHFVTHNWNNVIGWFRPKATQPQGGNEVANAEQVKNLYRGILLREGDPGGVANYTGRDANAIVAEMLGSQERKNLEARVNGQAGQLQALQNAINEQNRVITELNTSSSATKAQYQEAVAKLAELNAQLTEAHDQIADLQKNPSEVIKEVNPSWLEATISFVRKVLRIKD